MTRFVSLVLALSIAATPTSAFAVQPAAAAPEGDLDQVVCKRDKVIGSRVQKRRTCLTRREWQKLHIGTRDSMREMIQRSTQNANPTG